MILWRILEAILPYDVLHPERTERTRTVLAGLPLATRLCAARWLVEARRLVPIGYRVHLTSGVRTAEEQHQLFQAGNSERDGYKRISTHQLGRAIDYLVTEPHGVALWSGDLYRVLGELGERMGWTWGGRWVSLPDPYHLERPVIA